MYPVQQPDRPVVQIELLMVKVMHLGLVPEEIIATVHRGRVEQLKGQKQPERQYMCPHDLRRNRDRKCVGKDLLDRMGELRGQGDGRGELVVFLVDAHVEVGEVEEPVAVVEEGFPEQHTDEEIPDEFREPGERRLDSIGGRGLGDERQLEQVEARGQ